MPAWQHPNIMRGCWMYTVIGLTPACRGSLHEQITYPTTSGSWPLTLKGVGRVGWWAHAKLDMVAKPLRAGRILRGLPSDCARDLTSLMAEDSSAVDSGRIRTSAAHVTCSCRGRGIAADGESCQSRNPPLLLAYHLAGTS